MVSFKLGCMKPKDLTGGDASASDQSKEPRYSSASTSLFNRFLKIGLLLAKFAKFEI